jgi:hypothetical protein
LSQSSGSPVWSPAGLQTFEAPPASIRVRHKVEMFIWQTGGIDR